LSYTGLLVLDSLINVSFFIDLVICFLSPYYNEEYNLVDEPRVRMWSCLTHDLDDRTAVPSLMVLLRLGLNHPV
jgi:hypothetical protein